jgi:predicted dinucleotide-binding enzyme
MTEAIERAAIIGVGNVGAALGQRLAASGYEVVFGVRAGRQIDELLERCDGRAWATSPAEAVRAAEIVFLAVPAEAAVEALVGLEIAGKVIVDCNNPLSWDDKGPIWTPPPEGSTTAQLTAAYPDARFIKGFSTFGTEFHLDPDLGGQPIDVQLAGDDPEAKKAVSAIATAAGFRSIDAGPLRNAAALENLAVLWIQLAMFGPYGRQIGFQLADRG